MGARPRLSLARSSKKSKNLIKKKTHLNRHAKMQRRLRKRINHQGYDTCGGLASSTVEEGRLIVYIHKKSKLRRPSPQPPHPHSKRVKESPSPKKVMYDNTPAAALSI